MKFTSRPAAAAVAISTVLVSALAAHSARPQTKPATGPGTVQTKGPCRTYDTSVTLTSTTAGMSVNTEISGVFDPWAVRMTQTVSVASTGGSHFQFMQTSTWDTAEDFIAEVIRLKPPAGPPINPGPNPPPALVNDIIPPLLRARSTIGSGQIWFMKLNSYDTTNRLTSTEAKNAQGIVSEYFSAWDSTGRPTAGTMKSPVTNSTLAFSYDDKALTQTQTTTTNGLVGTITTKFDQYGNMRLSTASITRGQPSTTTYTPHSSATICLLDLRAAPAPVVRPLAPANGTFTAQIGAAPFTSSLGVKAENQSPVYSVGGGDGNYIVSIGLAAKPGPGEYKAGPPENVDFSKLTPEQFKDLMDHNTVVATVFDTKTKWGWQATPTIGSGSVNLTSVGNAMVGSFNLTLQPVPGTGATGDLRFSGSFNVKY